MSRPDPRTQALSAAFAGAIDLSALKNRPPPGAAPAAVPGPAGPSSPFVLTVDEAGFGEVVQASSEVLVVVELWSPRSSVGAGLTRALTNLAAQGNGAWLLARVDVDTNPRVAQAFGVQQIPTVVAVAAGQPVDAFTGVQTDDEVNAWVAALLDALRDRLPGIRQAEQAAGGPVDQPEPEDARFTAAEDLLDQGDFVGASAAYQAILQAEPGNIQARAALDQVDFLARADGHPTDAVEQADARPDDVPIQLAAADLQLAAGDLDGAFARLITTVSRTAGDERTAAREHLIGLFGLFPPDDDRVRAARRKLAAALY